MIYTFDGINKQSKCKSRVPIFRSGINSAPLVHRSDTDYYRLEGIIEQYSEQNKTLQSDLERLIKQNNQLLAVEKVVIETLDVLKERLDPKDQEYSSLIGKVIDSLSSKDNIFFKIAFR